MKKTIKFMQATITLEVQERANATKRQVACEIKTIVVDNKNIIYSKNMYIYGKPWIILYGIVKDIEIVSTKNWNREMGGRTIPYSEHVKKIIFEVMNEELLKKVIAKFKNYEKIEGYGSDSKLKTLRRI